MGRGSVDATCRPDGWLLLNHAHVRQESIAALRHRLDEPRRRRGVAEGLSNLLDGNIERRLEIDVRVLGPECSAQFLTRHELAGALREERQDAGRLILQRHAPALACQLAGRDVQFERAEPELPRRTHQLSSV